MSTRTNFKLHSQSGAALIVVLLFLVLIAVGGAIAVRQSNTDLKLATADQVDSLLLNTSDNTHKTMENIINASPTDAKAMTQKNIMLGPFGSFGYFMGIGNNNRSDQVVFCYRPNNDYFFRMSEATIVTPNGGSKLVSGSGTAGFCNPSKSSDYTNARKNVMTQVAVTMPSDSTALLGEAFEHVPVGKSVSTSDVLSSSYKFRIFSTSLLPSLAQSSTSDADINNCLKKPNENPSDYGFTEKNNQGVDEAKSYDETVSACLAKKGIPARTVVEEATLENKQTPVTCNDYGKGNGKLSVDCQKLLNANEDGTPK